MNVVLPASSQTTYLENLLNLEPEVLEMATRRTIREWDRPSQMPPIAFILARSGVSPQLAAEQAWEFVQRYVRKHWHPDVGHYTDAPLIPPAVDYAIRQVGGLNRIAYPGERDVDFIRRGFLEAHQRYVAEGGEQTKLSHADSKRLLDNLRTAQASGQTALPEKAGK